MNDFNLLPAKHVRTQAIKRRLWIWVVGAGLYTASIAMGAIATYAGTSPSRAANQRERAEIEATIDSGKKDIAQLNKQLAEARHRLKTTAEVSKHPDWSILLKVLADLRDPTMVLDGVELRKVAAEVSAKPTANKRKSTTTAETRFVLKLSGFAQSLESVPSFVLRLEAIKLFSSVKLVESRAADLNTKQVALFRVECSLIDAEGGAP
ncbi:MAG: PilN domain-containing protein [Planctomycetes bacterium]|nr:PilN domain-containing protein [Planctomycetota bacterium]